MSAQSPKVSSFNEYSKNVFSQFGEDGIIQEILARIHGSPDFAGGACVEFGAWDGRHLSNTYNLISNRGYSAVLIEADSEKYLALCENVPGDHVVRMNEFVTFEGDTTLDRLLSRTNVPVDFDLLSIDIDGNDYHILESLKAYRPKLICIEFNPTIPNEVEYVQPRDFGVKRGASPKSIVSLASSMDYVAVAATVCNLILLDRQFVAKVGLLSEPALHEIRDDDHAKVYLFCGYDGELIMSHDLNMLWHGFHVKSTDVQVLPRIIRKFPDDYSLLRRMLYRIFRLSRKSANEWVNSLKGRMRSN